jgi:hypothetical protein
MKVKTQEVCESPEYLLKRIPVANLSLGKHRKNESHVIFSTVKEVQSASLSMTISASGLVQRQLGTV